MLTRACERVKAEKGEPVRVYQGDFRKMECADGGYDVVLAAAVLHHLRDDQDKNSCFAAFGAIKVEPGGPVKQG